MKHLKISFLFFNILQLILVLSAPISSVAQSSKDSIAIYYQYIVAPKQPENITAGLNFYLKKNNVI